MSVGRVLREAFDAKAPVPKSPRNVARLNETLRLAHKLDAKKQAALKRAGFLTTDEIGRWHATKASADSAAFVARQQALLRAVPAPRTR